jgi:hypothetical protein
LEYLWKLLTCFSTFCSTFFKDYHVQLANTIKSLLTHLPIPDTFPAQMCQPEDPVNGKPAALTNSEFEHAAASTSDWDLQSNSGHDARLMTTSDGDMAARVGLEGIIDSGPSVQGSHRTVFGDGEEGLHNRIWTVAERSVGLEVEHCIAKVIGGPEAAGIAEYSNGVVSDNVETSEASEIELGLEPRALLFNPQRGGTLYQFVNTGKRAGLLALVRASFDIEVDRRNEELRSRECPEWLGYTEEHCWPLLLTLRPARHNC